MKENKQYRLKRWYPSLDERLEVGDIGDRYLFEFINGAKEERFSVLKGGRLIYIPIEELHPDFWELIEEEKPKPLFTTEDGVECFDRDEYITIGYDFNKRNMIAYNCDAPYSTGVIRFKLDSSADEYIWRNKPVFSYEDFIRWGNVPYQRVIEQLAKERSEA